MAKQSSKKLKKDQTPFGEESCVNLDEMSISEFRLWSAPALKAFLSIRKRSIEGSFDDLVARAFIAWEDHVAVDPSEEHALRSNLKDYKDRLVIGSNILPDPFTLKEGWLAEDGRVNWPSLYFCDIADYLKMTTPAELYHRLCNEYKQGKAFRYFTRGLCKEVHYHQINDQSPVAFLAAKVKPSFLQKNQQYEAWVCVEKDTSNKPGGHIYSAYCTCTAGLKGSCNHVAAVLFRVEYAVRTGLTKPSSTSQSCVWNVPDADRAPSEPIKLAEQVWNKDQYFKQNDGGHAKSVRQLATAFSPMSASQEGYVANDNIKSDLAGLLRQHAPQSCFVQLCDMRPFPKPKKVDCPPCPKSVALSLGHPATTEELTQAMALSEAQRESLNIATMKQSESSEWLDQRHGRITASNFHRVCTRMRTLQDNSSADPSALISSLMGYLPELKTVAVKHGKAMEPHAKKAYHKLQKAYHRKFSSEDSGLLIHRILPYVGASPDLLVSCCCGESKCPPKGICEIKCPESIKDQAPTCKNWSHLVEKDGVTSLKKTSLYYTQVQGQMAVAGVNYCDFFVYTDKGHHLERIMFDYDFWEEKEKLLTEFWRQYLSKELIFSSLANTITIREENVLSDHSYHGNPVSADLAHANQPSTSGVLKAKCGPLLKPKMPLVYMCGKCGGDLVDEPDNIQDESVECSKCQMWYHTRCVQLSNVDNVSGAIKWHCYQCADV